MEGSHQNDNDTDKNGPTWSLRHEFGIDIAQWGSALVERGQIF